MKTTGSSNTESIVLYNVLLQDAINSRQYWLDNLNAPDREHFINTYTALTESHKVNISRLQNQLAAANENSKNILEEMISGFETILETIGEMIPAHVKAWFEAAIRTAKKLLEDLIFKALHEVAETAGDTEAKEDPETPATIPADITSLIP